VALACGCHVTWRVTFPEALQPAFKGKFVGVIGGSVGPERGVELPARSDASLRTLAPASVQRRALRPAAVVLIQPRLLATKDGRSLVDTRL
jgi:hypothetical protein